jgi:uncharacterized protein involved in exopolysaccharide biosynthesis
MGIANREAGPGGSEEGGQEDSEFDLQQLKELAGFLLRAPRRRPKLAAFIFIVIMAFGLAVASFWPRTWGANVRILAQHNLVLPALDNPGRAVPREADSPTKNAADTIIKRDNVIALVKQLDLIDRWDATRQPILRLKDKIFLSLFGSRPEEDRLLDLIGFVEKRLVVATDESSITISIEWPDREMAYEVVALLLKNFLEARYDTNVNVITEAIRILEERAKPQSDEVDAALAELSRLETEHRSKFASVPSPSPTPSPQTTRTPSSASASTASPTPLPPADDYTPQLEEVRRRIREVDDDHRRRLAEAQNQLVDARTTLGPLHPTVVALNEKIAELSAPPAELPALRAREHDLIAKIAAGAVAAPAPSGASAAPVRPPTASAARPVTDSSLGLSSLGMRDTLAELVRDDPATALARTKLQAASAKYNELLSRIEAANIELDVTRASFKYQYTVVHPPELARKPIKPNVPLVILATLLGAFFLAVLIPGGLDLMRGRFVEPWQVERELNLPLLGELTPPR